MADSSYTTRKRKETLASGTGTTNWYYPATGQSGTPTSTRYEYVGEQITVSRGNPVSRLGKGNKKDVGGDFYSSRYHLGGVPKKGRNKSFDLHRFHVVGSGFFVDTSDTPLLPMLPQTHVLMTNANEYVSSDALLQAIGTKAIDLVKPTNSAADLSVTIAELKREGIPSLIGLDLWKAHSRPPASLLRNFYDPNKKVRKPPPPKPKLEPGVRLQPKKQGKLKGLNRNDPKAVAGEYLNWQFGWAPLVSDINKAIDAANKSSKIWAQYKRDSGRLVRRRIEFPSEVRVVLNQTNTAVPVVGKVVPEQFYNNNNSFTQHITKTLYQRRWFEGAFSYYVPDDPFLEFASKARKLYGVTIDPEVVWNLSPWSWLADWVGTTGSAIANLSDLLTDGLVMPYGYMMEETTVKTTVVLDGIRWKNGGPSRLSYTLSHVVKKRVAASPYGFGLTWESFTPRQTAILAALGISRRG